MVVERQPLWKRTLALLVYPAYLSVAYRSNFESRKYGLQEEFRIDLIGDLKAIITGEF